MPFRVSGKNMDIGDSLRGRISARIAEALDKHFQRGSSGHVTVSRDGYGFHTECVIHLPSGITLEAAAMAADPYASADQAALRIEKRLRRYQRRLKDRRAGRSDSGTAPQTPIEVNTYVIAPPEDDANGEVNAFNPVIVAEATAELKLMTISEAVIELDLTGAPVIVFRHSGHGRVNIVYRRADGHIGWVDPPQLDHDREH